MLPAGGAGGGRAAERAGDLAGRIAQMREWAKGLCEGVSRAGPAAPAGGGGRDRDREQFYQRGKGVSACWWKRSNWDLEDAHRKEHFVKNS